MTRRPVRIANFSGYLGDRLSALADVMAGDPVDVLMGDYLAEITLATLSQQHAHRPSHGYVRSFVRQIEPHLAKIAGRQMVVVTNAGGFDPAGLAAALRQRLDALGLSLSVAHVEGDNLVNELEELQTQGHDLTNMDTGKPLSSWGVQPLTANAYLGGWGIAAALRNGADIVVTGRVADAALTSGPAAWWHGWDLDDWNALAGAATAGHVIECGAHATGGNFSGFQRIPGIEHPGYPIAEIACDGSSVITKHSRDGGTVTTDTVTAQLVYEIQGPRYLTPDVAVHLDTVEVSQLGPDRVRIGPVVGSPPPPTTKVATFGQVGYQISQMVFMTAPDVDAKAALLRDQLIGLLGDKVDDLDITVLGTAVANPASQWEATVPIRIMATADRPEKLHSFAPTINSLYLSSYPGYHLDGGAPPATAPWPRIDYWPALLDARCVHHRAVLGDGSVIDAPQPPFAATAVSQPVHAEPADFFPLVGESIELGRIAFARSGDKGGNANVGVWVSDAAAWDWLRHTLTTAGLRKLIPEAVDLDIVRHEFPRLRAVHFVVKGILGTGGSSNLRVDQLGKSFGEYLRAKYVIAPATW
jgi:Acyclic terpene utilisation family protein AtuA